MAWTAALCAALLSGCVSAEKYDAEKARALNFQRLLAQEESRTSELNAQLQEAKIEIASLGSQKEELAVQIDSLRKQDGRPPSVMSSGSASAAMPPSAGDVDDMSFSDTSLSELGLPDLSLEEESFQDFDAKSGEEPVYHTVVAGETLYRLSRTYGVTVAQLQEWNRLTGNLIIVGQRLIVGTSR